jgi:hypothetical protein
MNEFPEILSKHLNKTINKIANQIAKKITLRIIQESFYKYTSTSSFYPTLTFIFKETNINQYPRKSQIKFHFPILSHNLTPFPSYGQGRKSKK